MVGQSHDSLTLLRVKETDLLRFLANVHGTFDEVLCHVDISRGARQEVTIVRVGHCLAACQRHVVDDLGTNLVASNVDVVHSCKR
jgi:hypothetical protein